MYARKSCPRRFWSSTTWGPVSPSLSTRGPLGDPAGEPVVPAVGEPAVAEAVTCGDVTLLPDGDAEADADGEGPAADAFVDVPEDGLGLFPEARVSAPDADTRASGATGSATSDADAPEGSASPDPPPSRPVPTATAAAATTAV